MWFFKSDCYQHISENPVTETRYYLPVMERFNRIHKNTSNAKTYRR